MEKHILTKLRVFAGISGALQIFILAIGALWLASKSVALRAGGFSELIPPLRLVPIEPDQFTFWSAFFFFSIPALILIVVFVGALKWDLMGAIGFGGIGAAYTLYIIANYSMPPILFFGVVFPGPALLSGVLYLIVFWFNGHSLKQAMVGA